MVDIEAIGDAATGGIIARTMEPATGEAKGHTHETDCLNCGCKLVGDYCHCCGQQAHVHRTVGAWWHDFLHSVLHLDGKFWRTVPMLALHPGELTRRYAEGERAKFISPLALFLFSVFLMFAVFSLLGDPMDFASDTPTQDRAQSQAEKASERQEARPGEEEADESEFTVLMDTGWLPLDRAVDKAEKNPSLLLYKLQANAYKFSWALIPISLPFVWLLFLHRRRYRREYGAYDHLVFITYSIAFMSLGGIVLALLGVVGLGSAGTGIALTFIPPIHIYVQLRGAYRLSRWSAIWRTFALLIFTSVALTVFLMLLVTVGVFS